MSDNVFTISKITDPKLIYNYIKDKKFPYNYYTDYEIWGKAYLHDIDGEGKILFSVSETVTAYSDEKLVGFIQYGKTAFGFDENGEISDEISHSVIRNFYFDEEYINAGELLLDYAVNALSDGSNKRIYAFFHYFGMSCYARHGKLFEGFDYINTLLLRKGFEIEHENVYYSSELNNYYSSGVKLDPKSRTQGNQQYFDFILDSSVVGGCELHLPVQDNIAYLRWIFVNENIRGNGIGTKCMKALKAYLFSIGITRFDTDTALSNKAAQHFYEKNDFSYEGITRSYFK